jgi:putative peptidoglycan lipid II flippase
MLHNAQFLRGTIILGATTFLSYLLGFLRDRLFAQTFGASNELDAYNAAFIIPDLLLNIFVAGALTAAFTPIFSELLTQNKKEEAEETMSSILNAATAVVIIVGILAALGAPWLTPLVAPGFDRQTTQLLVNMMRLLLLSPLIFAVSNTLGSVLLAKKQFFSYGISPALYNLGIIAGTLALAPSWGIYGVAMGTLFGSTLHLGARLIAMKGTGLRYGLSFSLSSPVKKIFILMLPKMVGHPVEQLTFLGFTAIASMLGPGSIATLNFARNFQSVPIGVIGIAAGLAMFPFLTDTSAQRDRKAFREHLVRGAASVLLLTVAAAMSMFLLNNWLVKLLLGGGKFDAEAVRRTASTLAVFTLAIPTESVSHILVRAFYALQNTLTPIIISMVGLAVTIPIAYAFSDSLGLYALPLGFFIGSLLKVVLLTFFLAREEKRFFSNRLSSGNHAVSSDTLQ